MKQLEKVFGVWVLALAAAVTAQTPPDFSGRWASAPPAATSGVRGVPIEPATMGSGWGTELTIVCAKASQLKRTPRTPSSFPRASPPRRTPHE